MREKFFVTFICENEDMSVYEVYNEVTTQQKLARLILSFEPKKNSKLVGVDVKLGVTLF